MMNISHYIIGFYHYFGTLISLIGESKGFVEGNISRCLYPNCSIIIKFIYIYIFLNASLQVQKAIFPGKTLLIFI